MIGIKLIDDKMIRSLIGSDMDLVFASVRDAFSVLEAGMACHPSKTKIYRPSGKGLILDDWIFAMPSYLEGEDKIAGLKWASRYPGHSSGNVHMLLILNETKTNKPIAILDGMYISLLRTFAITKLSINMIINEPKTVCIIGMGSLGRMHAMKLEEIFPSIEKIKCFSFNAKFEDIGSNKIIVCRDLESALDGADIVITCGQKRPTYISNKMISNATKLIVNLSLFDFDQSIFNKADLILVDDMKAVSASNTILGKMIRDNESCIDRIENFGDYLSGSKSVDTIRNYVVVNTLGMVAQDLVLANRILRKIPKDNICAEFKII